MSTDSVLDAINFNILSELYEHGPMRYVHLKTKLNVSDSSLTSRLNSLTAQKIVAVQPVLNDKGRNYFEYVLTDMGKRLVEDLDIPNILARLDELSVA
ncbi:MAG: winged helix-turn-helix transcriptional regulator [Nitrososphaerota archaeon]|nr:winged helix-turn-helix transcriptional regulator [Nitrososphaerota archaeon]